VGTFPPSVSQTPPAGGPAPSPGGGAAPGGGGGGSPAIKLAMLGQLIQGLAQQFPQGQQGIKMMLDGLKMVQGSAAAASTPPPQAAPPR